MSRRCRSLVSGVVAVLLLLFGFQVSDNGDLVGAATPWPDFLGFRLLQSDEDGVVFEFAGPPLEREQVLIEGQLYVRPHLPGYDYLSEAGQPELPQCGVLLAIPPGAKAKLSLLSWRTESFTGFHVPPAPRQERLPSLPGQDSLSSPLEYQLIYAKDPTIYGANAFFPLLPAELGETARLRDQRCVSVRLYPVQYNPVSSELRYWRYLKLRVAFEYPDGILPPVAERPESTAFEAVLRDALLNYKSSLSWRDPPTQAPSALRKIASDLSAPFYRIGVKQDGIYGLTYTDLLNAGLPVAELDPRTLRLYHLGAEVAVLVLGEDDGVFNTDDKLLFYGEALNNKYSDTNIYWLTYGQGPGLRMLDKDGTPSGLAPVPSSFLAVASAEQNSLYVNELPGPDELERWIWSYVFAPAVPRSGVYNINLPDVAAVGGTAHIDAFLYGWSSFLDVDPDHHVRLYVNNHLVADAWGDGKAPFFISADFDHFYLVSGANQVKVELPGDTGTSSDMALIDYFRVRYQRRYQAVSDLLFFSGDAAGTWEYRIQGFTTDQLMLFEITDPARPMRVAGFVTDPGSAFTLRFEDTNDGPSKYLALAETRCLTPASIVLDTPSDLRNPANRADCIVIAHRDLWTPAQALANYRQAASGLQTMLVDVQDIYDEFNYGLTHPQAIRNFLRYAYESWQAPAPSFVVLFGDGCVDPKNYSGLNTPSYIPPFLAAVDPWIVETAADERYAMVSGDDLLPDMHLGRLPVNAAGNQGQVMVSKIVSYEQSPPPGDWRAKLLFVADDADAGGPFEDYSDSLISDYVHLPYVADRVYVRDCAINPGLPTADGTPCRNQIAAAINDGRLLVNYIGHGAINSWAALPVIWRSSDIALLNNAGKYPIMLPLTCSDGYFVHFNPALAGLSESIVRAEDKGAIASWAAAGFGLISGHDFFNRGFLDAVLLQGQRTLGLATMAGKLRLFQLANPSEHFHLLTYILLGDPALRLPNQAAEGVGVNPDAGWSPANYTELFVATYRDGNGWHDIRYADYLVNVSADPSGGLYARYDRQANQLYLWDPDSNAWLGGYVPGQPEVIETANGRLDVSQCAVSGITNTLVISWAVAFKSPMAGATYNQYLKAEDQEGATSGWQLRGTWHVSLPPEALSVVAQPPLAAAWSTQYFTATCAFDPVGWEGIADVYLLINHDTDGAYGVYLRYDQNAGLLYLRDDADTTWLGGITPGSLIIVENSQAILKAAETAVNGSGTELRVRWALEFKPSFVGWRRNMYLMVADDKGSSSGWVPVGVWKVR